MIRDLPGERALAGSLSLAASSGIDVTRRREPRPAGLRNHLADLLRTGGPATILAVLEVYAFHWPAKIDVKRLSQFFTDPDAEIRAAAWRIACLCPGLASATQPEGAMSDDSSAVRKPALETGMARGR